MTASPTTCVLSESGGCVAGTTATGKAGSSLLTERAALRAWSFLVMRVIEALAVEAAYDSRHLETLRYCHELLIQAMDGAER